MRSGSSGHSWTGLAVTSSCFDRPSVTRMESGLPTPADVKGRKSLAKRAVVRVGSILHAQSSLQCVASPTRHHQVVWGRLSAL
mmetsp:Transcript_9401/g.18050  ORF Transcript_9401/g.18050 Transcript_9401/m.18050 type:complete len:83 (+) Transcript_9401:188-436(+)